MHVPTEMQTLAEYAHDELASVHSHVDSEPILLPSDQEMYSFPETVDEVPETQLSIAATHTVPTLECDSVVLHPDSFAADPEDEVPDGSCQFLKVYDSDCEVLMDDSLPPSYEVIDLGLQCVYSGLSISQWYLF